ncbi:MAG: cupin domain-containing protein [Vicinamibacteria bacterium]|jgi:mannose-6-phosphate isomerase-like protein (cupin superfamily)|nr:cupin domain-containing protein [Vicinamibacteria bacterium]
MPAPPVVDLGARLASFAQTWTPKVVASVDDHEVKVAKLHGEFVWHRHEHEDELFLVLAGRLRIEFRDGAVEFGPGQLVVVPRGVEHKPVADEEVHVLLFERRGVVNTGEVVEPRTVTEPERI